MTQTDPKSLLHQHHRTDQLIGVPFSPVPIDLTDAAAPVATAPADEVSPPAAAGTDKAAMLAQLHQLHDAECAHCTTAEGYTRTVFGEGDPDADLMFVGEAPGEQEDRTGRPFVGRAGQKLDEIVTAMGLRREDVYIANVLKARPPNNRTPLQHEVDACARFLAGQVEIIRPRAMVALGGPAAKFLLRTSVGITRLRGQWAVYEDETSGLSIPIMPTFHPAYLLRNYTPDTRKKVWSDMQAVMARLGE